MPIIVSLKSQHIVI